MANGGAGMKIAAARNNGGKAAWRKAEKASKKMA